MTTCSTSSEAPASPSFVGALGLELWAESDTTHGRLELGPEMCAPGTMRPRIGLLATLADVVAGSQPTGPINPTVDLRIQMLSMPSAPGTVRAVCRPLKVGRRLFVGETLMHLDGEREPFARSTVTFMNQPMRFQPTSAPQLRPAMTGSSFDELLAARYIDQHTVAVDPRPALGNSRGTVQGGVQALVAELASEWALAPRGRFAVTDLEIRYLNRVKGGPLVARAEVLSAASGGRAGSAGSGDVAVRVPLTDGGAGDRLVSLVSATCRRCDI
ncbi:MAG TPA: PaaI family thioesterase [Acidimicrobiales bacterium]|nr:PaaI family thioesterase [Acidimicrobiales bacterium]